MGDLLTTNDVAKCLGVAPDTVRYYERTGRLAATRTASGIRLFQRGDVEQFLLERSTAQNERLAAAAAQS